ncbi:LysR family transcriptional regulator [Devosia sp.]|uniref:LysR family transcriptional regulator n=1 Tax=Devosia sp. TaxID=1871048 RepID=UPI003267FC29
MQADLGDLNAFVAVARAKGFRGAARSSGTSPSGLSDAVRRLETQLGVRLLHRTTRSVGLTEAGQGLLDRLSPALSEVQAALDVVNGFRERPAGTLRLNVPGSAARLILPAIVPKFLAAYPEIRLDISTDESFVDILAEGCDAGIRYDDTLAQDMIAVPIGPRRQRAATAASAQYLARHPAPHHPKDLLQHACILSRFRSGAMVTWNFERDGETIRVEPTGPLLTTAGNGTELAVDAAIAGTGIIFMFEDWLRPHLDAGRLVPVLEDWWPSFSGPFLYYPGRRLVPAPLRAFIDFVKAMPPPLP